MMIFYIQKCLTMYSFKATKFILTGSLNCWWEPHVSPRVIKVYGRWSSKPNVSVCLRYRLCHPTYVNFFHYFIQYIFYFTTGLILASEVLHLVAAWSFKLTCDSVKRLDYDSKGSVLRTEDANVWPKVYDFRSIHWRCFLNQVFGIW